MPPAPRLAPTLREPMSRAYVYVRSVSLFLSCGVAEGEEDSMYTALDGASWFINDSTGRELCGRCYYHMSGDNEHLFNGGSESEEESELGSHLGSDPGSDADGESETEVE